MAATLSNGSATRHLLKSDVRQPMAKASLEQVRKADLDTWKAAMASVVVRVKAGLSLKEFADLVDRDERQVSRWLSGDDRPQFDAIFAVAQFREPLVIALAELAQSDNIQITTNITIRRSA